MVNCTHRKIPRKKSDGTNYKIAVLYVDFFPKECVMDLNGMELLKEAKTIYDTVSSPHTHPPIHIPPTHIPRTHTSLTHTQSLPTM